MKLVIIPIKMSPLDGQTTGTLLVGVGEGIGVALGRGVGDSVGMRLLVLVLVPVGITGSVPVIDIKLNWTRAWAEVVLSPKKRKFGTSYGSGKPSNSL